MELEVAVSDAPVDAYHAEFDGRAVLLRVPSAHVSSRYTVA